MNAPVRKSYHHTRVLWDGGVISDRARFCHEFGANPDVEELKEYNAQAKARECQHIRLERHERDDGGGYWICRDCTLSDDPNWRDKFEPCRACVYRSSYDRTRCPKCNNTHLVRRTSPSTTALEQPKRGARSGR